MNDASANNHQPPPDRRISVRWSSEQLTPCHFATLSQITCRWAKVLDVSRQGIGLLLPVALELGQELIVELPSRDPFKLMARVARVMRIDADETGQWFLGCRFVQPLTEDDLISLL